MYLEVGRLVELMTARSLPNSLRFWPRGDVMVSSRDDVMDHPARDIGEAKIATVVAESQTLVLEAQ